MKLDKLQHYILEREEERLNDTEYTAFEFMEEVVNRTKFGQLKLLERYDVKGVSAHPLNRFVAVDLDGKVLRKPERYSYYLELHKKGVHINTIDELSSYWVKECQQYHGALSRVIFEGFQLVDYGECTGFSKYGKWVVNKGLHLIYLQGKEWEIIGGYKTIEDLTPLGLVLTNSAIG